MSRREPAYPILDQIKNRWSPCTFSDKPVGPEKIHSLFEAARWAPSCYNEQPWSFIIDSQKTFLPCLVDANQEWAKTAPILGFSVACLNFEKNQKPNRHAYHDVGLAMGLLIIQAVELGLSVHQMAGFHMDKTRETCKIPEGYDPVAAFAIGYEGDPTSALEKIRLRDETPSQRQGQSTFLFETTFGVSHE